MRSISKIFLVSTPAVLAACLLFPTSGIAAEKTETEAANSTVAEKPSLAKQEVPLVAQNIDDLDSSIGELEPHEEDMGQVNNVFQLRDVSPGDWAFEALRNLVERYGCIAGFPNGTYRGNRPLTRYEFAAGLNACMQQIERLIAAGGVSNGDLESTRRLAQEFEAELATIGTRVDNLEGRVGFLEDNQFSTTTKLVGEVAFTLAGAFGGDESFLETDALGNPVIDPVTGNVVFGDDEPEIVFNDRVRLQFVTSFTGKDKLFTRLTAGNVGNTFADEIFSQEGRFAHDGQFGNDITIDRLHYVFPVGEKLTVTTMANLGGHWFYAETFNPGLEAGGGANGALSRFGERNPIYRLGLGGTGLGATYQFSDAFEISAGYLAPDGSSPASEEGLFNGDFSALGQLVIKPTDRVKLGFTYLRGYNDSNASFNFGGTGTTLGNLSPLALGAIGPVTSDTFGGQVQFDLNSRFSIRGWFGYTSVDSRVVDADATVLNYAGALVLSDFGKEGNQLAIIVGAEPYLTDLEVPGPDPDFEEDVPLHIEGLYKYKVTENITVTPGLIWLINPNQGQFDQDDVFIGTLRTTFSF